MGKVLHFTDIDKDEKKNSFKIERTSFEKNQSQIFIETPQ
jgi:16S rRNA (cytidine1402-2'-O)-methyltransferase